MTIPRFSSNSHYSSIPRGFKFDRIISPSPEHTKVTWVRDAVSLISVKRIDLPDPILTKILSLLRDFGNKKQLEEYGKYLTRKMKLRSHSELPSILPSCLAVESRVEKDDINKYKYKENINDITDIKEEQRPNIQNKEIRCTPPLIKKNKKFSLSVNAFIQTQKQIKRVLSNPTFDELREVDSTLFDLSSSAPLSTAARLAVSLYSESRHKRYNITFSPEATLAYTAIRMAPCFASNFRVFSEIQRRCRDVHNKERKTLIDDNNSEETETKTSRKSELLPKKIIDFGSKTAASVIAMFEIFGSSITDVLCVEPSINMKNMANYFLSDIMSVDRLSSSYDNEEKLKTTDKPRITWISQLYEPISSVNNNNNNNDGNSYNIAPVNLTTINSKLKSKLPGNESDLSDSLENRNNDCKDQNTFSSGVDIAVMSYSLMDLQGQHSRDMVVRNLWNRLEYGGLLVVIERGTPAGFRMVHQVRELFVSQLKSGCYHFVAPCPHEGLCPLSQTGTDWCHFEQRVSRLPWYIYQKGGKEYVEELEKFSYLVVRKSPRPIHNIASHSRDLLQKNIKDRTNSIDFPIDPVTESYSWPRVVKNPQRKKGHVLIDVCSQPGVFERIFTSKSQPEGFGYRASRKLMIGDLWRYPKRSSPEVLERTPEEKQRVIDNMAKGAQRSIQGLDKNEGLDKNQENYFGS